MRGATYSGMQYNTTKVGFQSTRPMRGATSALVTNSEYSRHFNPRAPCGARLKLPSHETERADISIHAPHAGRDQKNRLEDWRIEISIHAPHAGRDSIEAIIHNHGQEFQSTRPMRGATRKTGWKTGALKFQSTRPMRGATYRKELAEGKSEFQSTRPMRGATRSMEREVGRTSLFQSTRPMRGATRDHAFLRPVGGISIHAPHAGRDG